MPVYRKSLLPGVVAIPWYFKSKHKQIQLPRVQLESCLLTVRWGTARRVPQRSASTWLWQKRTTWIECLVPCLAGWLSISCTRPVLRQKTLFAAQWSSIVMTLQGVPPNAWSLMSKGCSDLSAS